ncbi:hypothetical protein HPULCUR_001610 [Helicostylum pulchrum]|uniref:Uncharacterized protein n=1 Tax=Helicostylum pulchrum TaxID=562976 RepID=A0ABP9XPF2_9FUNG
MNLSVSLYSLSFIIYYILFLLPFTTPGVAFMPHGEKTEYVRVSYSNVSKENMDEGLRSLAKVFDQEAEANRTLIN